MERISVFQKTCRFYETVAVEVGFPALFVPIHKPFLANHGLLTPRTTYSQTLV